MVPDWSSCLDSKVGTFIGLILFFVADMSYNFSQFHLICQRDLLTNEPNKVTKYLPL